METDVSADNLKLILSCQGYHGLVRRQRWGAPRDKPDAACCDAHVKVFRDAGEGRIGNSKESTFATSVKLVSAIPAFKH